MSADSFRVYLHGAPGSPAELTLCDTPFNCYAPDRFALVPGLDSVAAFDALAGEIDAYSAGRPVHLIGFSMGGFAALQAAHRLGERVSKIDLIAAAAPLELGVFLPDMAGRAVFNVAKSPLLFGVMTRIQAALAAAAPALFQRMLFATAQGADRALVDQAAFKKGIAAIFKTSLGRNAAGYAREVQAYVRPWAAILDDVTVPVTIWEGSEDNWAPPAMAKGLAKALPNVVAAHDLPGLSHYSTLRAVIGLLSDGQAQRTHRSN
jgi:pimeloyl-ACP methyl ester carboxylesterase